MKRISILSKLWLFCCLIGNLSTLKAQPEKTPFWYSSPAADWKAAIPIGNGRIGGIVFGDPVEEQILINENSIWCGQPFAVNNPRGPELIAQMRQLLFEGKYVEAEKICNDEFLDGKAVNDKANGRSYQPFGFLHMKSTKTNGVSEYVRWLDYDHAITYVSYIQDGVQFTREAFVSAPDQVMVMRLTADKPGQLSFTAGFDRPFGATAKVVGRNKLYVTGRAFAEDGDYQGVCFDGVIQFLSEGGKVSAVDDKVQISGANSVTVLIAISTDYNLEEPLQPLTHNRIKRCEQQLANAGKKKYTKLRADHIADYTQLYNRSKLDVRLEESSQTGIPVDERIKAAADGVEDPGVLFLYYRYCRYLLISSSREGGLPMNLQGIWNPFMKAPWRGNFHININQQEAYWFAEQANLSECHEPMFTLTEKLAANGKETAKTVLGVNRGFASGHRTDVWFPSRIIGYDPCHGMYVVSGTWCAQHMMEHYRFTQDKEFLQKRAYPVLRDAALFFVDWLVPDPGTGKLVSGPSASAENKFRFKGSACSISMGPSQDQEMIWGAFTDYLEACKVLGISNDETEEVRKSLEKLALPKIGSDGRLMEWSEEFVETEPGHRHLSHLWGMMPGHRITPQGTPYLAEAVRKSLYYRLKSNYSAQGWSLGWVVCLLARLQEGDRALNMMEHEYFKKVYPNMFVNAHGQVQVGDMMGVPLAMIELLLQSHAGYVELLPALPTAWKEGKVTGVCVRGGFVIDLEWKDGKLLSTTVFSRKGGKCMLHYGNKITELNTEAGRSYRVDF